MKEEQKYVGKQNEKMDKGPMQKNWELWDQSDNTWQKAIWGVYSYIVLAQGWQKRSVWKEKKGKGTWQMQGCIFFYNPPKGGGEGIKGS